MLWVIRGLSISGFISVNPEGGGGGGMCGLFEFSEEFLVKSLIVGLETLVK